MKTLVIGLGNPILTDDSVGIHVARAVQAALPPDAGVAVTEQYVGGLALMETMVGYERVILVDAIWTPDGEAGQVVQFAAGDLPDTLNTASTHDADLPTALRVGKALGASVPDDENIQIVAVQAQEVLTFSETPTPPVAAAIPQAVCAVLSLLDYALPYHQVLEGGCR